MDDGGEERVLCRRDAERAERAMELCARWPILKDEGAAGAA